MDQSAQPIDILLVEDHPGNVRLTLEALKECKIVRKISVVCDGVEAMAFLRREGSYSKETRPDLILLDLNLPRKDGREVLAEIKADEKLKQIPVIILTVSSSPEDIFKAYDDHANCYVTKPAELSEYMGLVKTIEDFWTSVAKLPRLT